MIPRQELEDLYPLTPLQEGMLIHRLDPAGPGAPEAEAAAPYQVQVRLRLAGRLDAALFRRAWQELAARHGVLRTRFVLDRAERPLQAVLRRPPLDWRWRDLGPLPDEERDAALDALRREERREPLDPVAAPPWRLTVARLGVRLGDDQHELLWSFHHALLDGWSAAGLLAELLGIYAELAAAGKPAGEPRRPFSDYVAWLEAQDRAAAVAFWREELEGYVAAPAFPGRSRGGTPGRTAEVAAAEVTVELGADASERLGRLAAAQRTTLAQLLETAWGVLVGSYGARRDVAFGAVVTVRPAELAGAESMVGLLVNTVPVRVRWRCGESFADLLARRREALARRQPFLHAPLAEAQPRRGLIDHLFAFESYPIDARLRPAGGAGGAELRLTSAAVADPTPYDLEVVVDPGRTLRTTLRFRETAYDRELMAAVAARFAAFLAAAGAAPDRPLEALLAPGPEEGRRILDAWSGVAVAASPATSFLDRFAAQVAAHPDAVALAWEGGAQTYRRLAAGAEVVARRLRFAGIGAGPGGEDVVALFLGRGVELVTAILGVLRAGAAFLPIDPAYPRERQELMWRDAGVRALATAAPWAERLAGFDGPVLRLDEPTLEPATPAARLPRVLGAQLAYLIYTSGSTGRPKAAQLHHRGLANFTDALAGLFGLGPGRRVLQLASPSFDASVWEIVAALGSGATLVLAEPEALEPGPPLFATFASQRVSDSIVPPSTLAALPHGELPALRCLTAGGEACPAELVETWAPGRRFFNAYGPTEATVCVTVSEETVNEERRGGAPAVGRPLAGTRAYLLDGRLEPVATAALGEVLIGGAGVGRGYRGRPGATAERFVPDPWSDGGRLYRTGDLGRFRASGELELAGRRDDQVKVRGFRIELGEVESALAGVAGVAQAAAVVAGEGVAERALVGFVVPVPVLVPGARLDGREIAAALARRLPASMVPSRIEVLAELPRTPVGKLDRRALAALAMSEWARVEAPGPRSGVEEAVAATWGAVLGRARVGPGDDFFALGGHSLLAAQAVSRLRQLFAVELGVRDLFAAGTVAALAARIEELRQGTVAVPPPEVVPAAGEEARHPPLSFGQERLWVLEQLRPGTATYDVPAAATLVGPLSLAALEQALGEVVRRHQVLRTRFSSAGGRPRATVVDDVRIPLAIVDLEPAADRGDAALARRLAAEEAARPFDLERGPLLRAALIRGAGDAQVLLWTLHHVAADGWSMALLGREVRDLYRAFAAGEPSPLAELPFQYGDFARWQRRWLEGEQLDGERLERQLAHWREHLAGAPPVIALPLDRPRGAARGGRGGRHRFRLEPELVRALGAVARRRGATLHMTLLAGYAALLHRLGGDRDLVIGTLAANRRAPGAERLIGFFVNTLPLRIDLGGDPTFGELVDRARATALAAYDHEEAPFERIVAAVAPDRSPHHQPLVQTILVLLNTPRAELELAGVATGAGPLGDDSSIRFDLEVYLWEEAGGLAGDLLYDRDLFDAATAGRLARQLATLLRAAVAAPSRPVSRLGLLDGGERERLLAVRPARGGSDTSASILDRVAASVRRYPDRPAVVAGEEAISYAGLDLVTRRLAGSLREAGVCAGTLVGVAADRSAATLVAMLAVLRAGAAYVPIDPSDPPARVALLAEDSGMRVLVGARALLDDPESPLAGFAGRRVAVEEALAGRPCGVGPAPPPRPGELAYVIYTSGSTGRPKGVAVTHEGLAHYLGWAAGTYAIDGAVDGRGVDCAFFTSPSFDLTVTALFLPLLTGGRVVVYPRAGAADTALFEVARDGAVDVLKLTPAHLALLAAEKAAEGAAPSRVRRLIVGGEQLTCELARQARRRFGEGVVIHNEYGPTETVVGCSVHAFDPRRDRGDAVPIGRAIDGCRVLVLDPLLEPAAPGMVGEVYVAGPGVARGYLGRPGLTAARFLPLPFAHGERTYRTGDLATWDEAGCLRFRGRADREVKLRGFRVDLREVEAVLAAQPGVSGCAVTLRRRVVPTPAAAGVGCVRCGLDAGHPRARLDGDGVCQVCREFDTYRDAAGAYFRPLAELEAYFAAQRALGADSHCAGHDCLVLYSGGKDSTYALYQLAREMGLRTLVLTLDNGFLSREALANVARVVAALGLEHVVATFPQMNEIFVDSLRRHSNVCNGCFKTLYTAALDLARERGIRTVVTGLSRGQMFETRLADLFRAGIRDPDEVDRRILGSRKAYHRETDAVGRLLAGDLFADDRIFDQVAIVDFFRYCDVELAEMLRYLDAHAPWIRPSDTGRSTNCLINDLGIAVHRRERGFHNYALPYSWDVRLGHKTREEAAAELDDAIDPAKVSRLLGEIGHPDPEAARPAGEARLVAYLTGAGSELGGSELGGSDLAGLDLEAVRAAARERLPAHMVPAAIVELAALPLTPHGKVDWAALPEPDAAARPGGAYVAPRTPIEARLAVIWAEVLALERVGVEDDFFALGGHSLLATQIMARLSEAFGVELPMQAIVEHPTVAGLAAEVTVHEEAA